MELLRNARLSSAESKLEAQLDGFRRVSIHKNNFNNNKRSSSVQQIRQQRDPPLKINELYNDRELQKLKKQVSKNPLDATSQIFIREIRKQEAKQNNFLKDENNFINRSTYRQISKQLNSQDENKYKIRSDSMDNINKLQKQQTFYKEEQNMQLVNDSKSIIDQKNNGQSEIQLKFLNKNMSAQFTNKGSARNVECLKYRMIKYTEHKDILSQKKLKNAEYKIQQANIQNQNLKSQLSTVLVQLKELSNSDDIDKAITQITRQPDNKECQQSPTKSLTDRINNLNGKEEKLQNSKPIQTTQTGLQQLKIKQQSFQSQSAKKNANIQKQKDNLEENSWKTNFMSRQKMIQDIKKLNKDLINSRVNTSNYTPQKFEILSNNYDDNLFTAPQEEDNKDIVEENEINYGKISQSIDPEDRPIYFDISTGKRALGVTENERRLFANFLADKNLNVLLYSRKFDVEPNGHLQKHLVQIKQQNAINQQIRGKFNQQMLDDQIRQQLKNQSKLSENQILNQSSINKTQLSGFLAGELTPKPHNQSHNQFKQNTQTNITQLNQFQEEKNNISQTSRSISAINDDTTPKRVQTDTNLTEKINENQFIQVGQFLKQIEKQNSPAKRTQSASIIKVKKINSLINQQTQNMQEMRQISLIKDQSRVNADIQSQPLIKCFSPSKLHIPLSQAEVYQSKQGQDNGQYTNIQNLQNGIEVINISPIKKKGESTIRFSNYNQIHDTNKQIIQSMENNQDLLTEEQRKMSDFSQAIRIQQQHNKEADNQLRFIRQGHRKAKTQVSISNSVSPIQKQTSILKKGNQTQTNKQNNYNVKILQPISQTTNFIPQSNNSLAHIPEQSSINQPSFSSIANKSRSLVISSLKKGQELINTLFPKHRHNDLIKEQDIVLLEKYKYLVPSDKITRVNLKKERRKQKGISEKLPKKMFDEIGYVYGRNPFTKFKSDKLMKIRLSMIKYLQKIKYLNININEIVEKKIYPLKPYERPGAYIFLNLCKSGSVSQIEETLKNNPYHVNDYNELNQTGLHIAAYYNKLDICLILLKYYSNPDLIDSTGKTALYYALKNKNHLLVRYLFYYRATPWSRLNLKYSELQMDEEMKSIFDAAKIVHFMIQLPYDYNEKVWEIFMKNPIPDVLYSSSELEQNEISSLQQIQIQDEADYSFQFQQPSEQKIKIKVKNNNNVKSCSSLSQLDTQTLKYASINSISQIDDKLTENSIEKQKEDDFQAKLKEEQDQYYGNLFRQQNYS